MPKGTSRRPSETINLIDGETLTNNQVKTFRDIFPVGKGGGEGYKMLRLTFHHTIVAGTAATPRTEGGILAVQNISLRTSKNEEPHNTPAMGLHLFNKLFFGVEPVYTAIAASDGTYDAIVDIPFEMPFLARREDTILDSGRYSHLELQIALGGLADMFATPGTATLVTKVDIGLLRTKTTMDPDGYGKPHFLPYIAHLPPFRADTKKYADIESARDLILFGFFAVGHDLSWGSEGTPFVGARADCLDKITWKNSVMPFVQNQKVGWFQQERALMSNDRAFTGVYPHLFTRSGTFKNAFYTGDQSEIRFEVGGILGSPTTPQVDLMIFGARTLRP